MSGDNGDSRVDALTKRIADKQKEINSVEVTYKSVLEVIENTKVQDIKLVGQIELLQSDLDEMNKRPGEKK